MRGSVFESFFAFHETIFFENKNKITETCYFTVCGHWAYTYLLEIFTFMDILPLLLSSYSLNGVLVFNFIFNFYEVIWYDYYI